MHILYQGQFTVTYCFIFAAISLVKVTKTSGLKVELSLLEMHILQIFGLFLEVGWSWNVGKLGKLRVAIITLWLFACIVTTNLYKSIVTNDVTAPLTSDPPTTFDQLKAHQFNIYSTKLFQSQPNRASLTVSFLTYREVQNEFDDTLYGESWKRTHDTGK